MKKIFVLFTLIIYLLLSAEKSCVLNGQSWNNLMRENEAYWNRMQKEEDEIKRQRGLPSSAVEKQFSSELDRLAKLRSSGNMTAYCAEAHKCLDKWASQYPGLRTAPEYNFQKAYNGITSLCQSVRSQNQYSEMIHNSANWICSECESSQSQNQYSQPFTNQPSSLQNQTELELQLQNPDRQNIERNQRFVEDSKNEIDNIEVPKSKISMENDNTEKIVPGVVVPGYGLPMITFNNIEKQELQNFKNELGEIDDVEEYEKWEEKESEESKGTSENKNLDDLEKQHLEWHKKTVDYLSKKMNLDPNQYKSIQNHQVVNDQNVSIFDVDQASDRFSKVNLNDETSEDVEFGIGPISVENKPKETVVDKLRKKWSNLVEVNPGRYNNQEEEMHLREHAEQTMNPFYNPKLLIPGVNVLDSYKNTNKILDGFGKNFDKSIAVEPEDKDTFFERNF